MRSNGIAVLGLSVVLAVTACQKRVPNTALPPAPGPAVANVSPLEQANRAFAAGRYEEAGQGYENYLNSPATGDRDTALFNLALSYILRPAPDWTTALKNFKDLATGFPKSPLKPPADMLSTLYTDITTLRSAADQNAATLKQRDQKIQQLTTELDRLKKIDADRRKRP
jgi:hypothetical protein